AHLFLLTTFIIGLLLIAALLSRRDNRKANLLLCAILASGLYVQFIHVLKVTGQLAAYPLLWGSAFPFGLLIPSLLYLYILALTVPGFSWSRRHLIHLLPFGFGLIFYLGSLLLFRSFPILASPPLLAWWRYSRIILGVLITGFYFYLCFKQLGSYRELVYSQFSE